jgi:catalase
MSLFPQLNVKGPALFMRLMPIGLIILGIIVLFAYAGGWLTPDRLTQERIIHRFEQLNGSHPGFRRNHAKGLCFSGRFESNGAGVALSKADIFRPGSVPVIGRFSLSGGQPYAADAATTVRGMGILFELPDGEEWRTAMVNLPVFPARTAQAFYDLLLASAPVGATGKPNPAQMQAFLAKYPETAKALQMIRSHPPSSGFANTTFNSLNAFRFINGAGTAIYVRWSMVPVQPIEPFVAGGSEQGDKNFQFDALIASIHQHPLQWHLIVTIAQPGDPTDDATLPWPPDRVQVDVGTLTLQSVESEDIDPARDINFDPLILPNGIGASDDPILSTRSAVYSRSFTLREGESKHPSAISVPETEK